MSTAPHTCLVSEAAIVQKGPAFDAHHYAPFRCAELRFPRPIPFGGQSSMRAIASTVYFNFLVRLLKTHLWLLTNLHMESLMART